MEKKNEYELIELILGTRNLYRQHERDLRLLRHFCTPTKKNVKDYYFYVHQSDKKSPELYCSYTKNQNAFQKKISRIKDFIVGNDLTENDGLCVKDDSGNYTINGFHSKFPVKITSPITFRNMASELLDSEFVRKIKLTKDNSGAIKSSDENSSLYFTQCNITLDNVLGYCIKYLSTNDTIMFMSFDKKISTEIIEHTLKVKFPADKLNEYHLTSIHSSIQKPIVFEEKIKPCRFVEYEMKEEEKQIVLSKKRR